LPLQARTRLSQQLNSDCQLLKLLLLGVCAGYCGTSSSWLFDQLLLQVQQHNSRVLEAAADGLVGADRLRIDVLSMREKNCGRTLLHMLVSEFPSPVLMPDGSLHLSGLDELVQYITRTAATATDPAAAAAAAAAGGGGVGMVGGMSLEAVAQAAAEGAAANASSDSKVLPPQQRQQLLERLRQLARDEGRWQEVLRACNSNGATAWLTTCHWCNPEALSFFCLDPEFELEQDMLCPHKNGEA
jgi:hypothetical protein